MRNNKGASNALLIIILLLAGVALLGGGFGGIADQIGTSAKEADDAPVDISFRDVTASVTLTFDSFTGEHGEAGSETEVYPAYTVLRNGNVIAVRDAQTNSTTAVELDDAIDLYGTGATYYVDPVMGFPVSGVAPVLESNSYAAVATTNLVMSAYQDDGTTALTADDNANNSADYAGGSIGAGEYYQYVFKIKNNVADKTFRLGAILTGYCGDEADDFELLETYDGSSAAVRNIEWEEVSIPSGKLKSTIAMSDDISNDANTSCSWQHAYVPVGVDYVDLHEWDWMKVQTSFDADDSTGPTANGDTYIYLGIADYSCEISLAGDIVCDWYKHDTNGDPADVGVDESLDTTLTGLDIAAAIEPQ